MPVALQGYRDSPAAVARVDGRDRGQAAVQRLERLYGRAWRPCTADRVVFSRQKAIIDQIQARIRSGLTSDEAVKEVEKRPRVAGGFSPLGPTSLYKGKASVLQIKLVEAISFGDTLMEP